jgi:fatty acid desaturase
MLAVIFGLIFMVLGIWGLAAWWWDFVAILRGLIPPLIICGGLLAVIAGVTSMRDAAESKAAKEAEDKKE